MFDEAMMAQLRRLKEAFRDPLAETIYHYTSLEGFRGIVTSGEIWLTNAAFVNDTTECKLFWEIAARLFRRKRLPNRHVQELLDKGSRAENDTYYIASFSQEPNSLRQYRVYGSVCIGFDPRRMNGAGFNLYKCVYAERAIKRWIHEKSTVPEWDGSPDAVKEFAAKHLVFAAEKKHKSGHYHDEREVRVVSLSNYTCRWPNSPCMFEDDPPIHFRDHPVYRMPLPYVKFFISPGKTMDASPEQERTRVETTIQMRHRKLDEEDNMPRELLPITEVSIGPMARKDEAKLACEIMLQAKGYENVPVQVPDIPYRGA
jgi:hypothetical protein